MWLVMICRSFELEQGVLPIDVKIDSGKMVGFAPIYKNKKDALRDYPHGQIFKIKPKEEC